MKLIDKEIIKMKVLVISILTLFILTNCSSNSSEENAGDSNVVNLESVRFLEGTWVDKSTFGYMEPPKYMMETWKSYPDSLSGAGYSIKGSDTILMEYIAIKMINDKLTYVARPKGQSMVSFTIISNGKGSFTFENKANDYPQKLIYEKRPNDSLHITLDGVTNSIQRTITFKYEKE
jgi:hypothetical protein